MGLCHFGSLIKFIPYTITTGFTSGIAITIVIGQLKDFFGVTYPDGVTGETSGYTLSATYAFGNRYLSYIWNTDPEDLNEKYEEFNDNAIKSKALGFVFDTTPVKAEAAAVQAVMDEYRLPLENGVIDPDENLPKFRQALKDAGIDTVIAEKQRQIDEWAATK